MKHKDRKDLEAQLLLLPVIGTFTDRDAMIAAWLSGRNFKVHRGWMHVNIDDIPEMKRQGIDAIVLQGSYKPDAPVHRISLTAMDMPQSLASSPAKED